MCILYHIATVCRAIQPNYLSILIPTIDCSKDMQASTFDAIAHLLVPNINENVFRYCINTENYHPTFHQN